MQMLAAPFTSDCPLFLNKQEERCAPHLDRAQTEGASCNYHACLGHYQKRKKNNYVQHQLEWLDAHDAAAPLPLALPLPL